MDKKLGLEIEASLNTQKVNAGVGKLQQDLHKAAKVKVDPVPDAALKKAEALLEAYKKIDREFARRVKYSNQEGKGLSELNFGQLYSDPKQQKRKLSQIEAFIRNGGGEYNGPQHHKGGGSAMGNMAAQTAQAGMRATGPVGAVAANAVGTGMSAGFGAGLMGLVGGMAALGVSKLVGAVVENIEKAENNNIAYDRLKRTLGDVNVSFEGLKSAVMQTGEGLKITYSEAEQLSSQFAKSGNMKRGQYSSLPEEVGLGVGLAKAFGLDNAQGVGFLGAMRGSGNTRDTQESRRIALLIGETIAKSDAFAKADEVMDAIAGYATSQARANLSVANTAEYAGMFAGMASSGTPGLDPANIAGILSRVNATLAAGGGKGEASQFFTSRLGGARGMDVFDTQLWREGGAFATADSVFGGNGAVAEYYRRNGLAAPKGSESLISANIAQLKGDYKDPKMLLNATANQMGVNMSTAAAILNTDPKVMGELEKILGKDGFKGINASGIGNAALAVSGTDQDRRGIANSLLAREDLKKEDRDSIEKVMAGTDTGAQKEVLAKLSAQYEQERTMGSDIRDTRNALDNIKTKMADYVVPSLLDIRKGILYLAGDGKKSPNEVMADILKSESKDKVKQLESQHDKTVKSLEDEKKANKNRMQGLNTMRSSGMISKEKYAEEWGALNKRNKEIDAEIDAAETKRDAAVEAEKKALPGRISAINKSALDAAPGATAGGTAGGKPGATSGPSSTPVPMKTTPGGGEGGKAMQKGRQLDTSAIDDKLAEAERRNGLPEGILKSVMQQETGGKQDYLDDPTKYHYALNADGKRIAGHTGKESSAFGPFGILEKSTAKNPGYGVSPLKDKSIDEQIRFAAEYLAARSRAAGSLEEGLAGYGEGKKYSDQVMGRLGTRKAPTTPRPANPRGDFNPAKDSQQANMNLNASGELTVRVVGDNSRNVQVAQSIPLSIGRAQPDTYARA